MSNRGGPLPLRTTRSWQPMDRDDQHLFFLRFEGGCSHRPCVVSIRGLGGRDPAQLVSWTGGSAEVWQAPGTRLDGSPRCLLDCERAGYAVPADKLLGPCVSPCSHRAMLPTSLVCAAGRNELAAIPADPAA
jgi:hypothetical protein